MTLEAQLLARACGKTNIHSLEPEDMAALTMEASALAKVPLSGTNHTVGVDEYHKIKLCQRKKLKLKSRATKQLKVS